VTLPLGRILKINRQSLIYTPSEKENKGIYKLTFYTKEYFSAKNVETFYPFIEVVFEIEGTNHFHVPITLSAFGYSTYRGN
jgi:5-hydroxyisourate hydrolase